MKSKKNIIAAEGSTVYHIKTSIHWNRNKNIRIQNKFIMKKIELTFNMIRNEFAKSSHVT